MSKRKIKCADPVGTLLRFVIRARRVEEHSLAADKDRLLARARGTIQVKQDEQGQPVSLSFDLPEEETLDSLAARCRPFVLKSDAAHHLKVMDAIEVSLPNAADGNEEVELLLRDRNSLAERWSQLDPSSGFQLIGYGSSVGQADGSFAGSVTDKALAFGWLYGDLVHTEPRAVARVGEHDIDSRFQAGVLLVSLLAVRTIETLNYVRVMHKHGLIGLDDECFSQRVLARGERDFQIAAIAVSEVGTPAATLEAAIDAAKRQAADQDD